MDIWSILNLIVACICAFACGYNIEARNYDWAAMHATLAIVNLIVAFM